MDIQIGGDKFQCNHVHTGTCTWQLVHGVRVDDMREQCRYTCSSEYPEKCPEITILVIVFNFSRGQPQTPGLGAPLGPMIPPTTHDRPTSKLLPAPLHHDYLVIQWYAYLQVLAEDKEGEKKNIVFSDHAFAMNAIQLTTGIGMPAFID